MIFYVAIGHSVASGLLLKGSQQKEYSGMMKIFMIDIGVRLLEPPLPNAVCRKGIIITCAMAGFVGTGCKQGKEKGTWNSVF